MKMSAKIDYLSVMGLAHKGFTQGEIARQLDTTSTTICNICKKHNIVVAKGKPGIKVTAPSVAETSSKVFTRAVERNRAAREAKFTPKDEAPIPFVLQDPPWELPDPLPDAETVHVPEPAEVEQFFTEDPATEPTLIDYASGLVAEIGRRDAAIEKIKAYVQEIQRLANV
jgi:hypothetical protein